MNDNTTTRGGGGIGFAGILTIVFIILKLLGKINWSWIWVLSPLWISLIVTAILFMIVLIVFLRK